MMLESTSAIEEILAEKEDEGNPWEIRLPPKSRRYNPVVGTRKSSRILSREDAVMGGGASSSFTGTSSNAFAIINSIDEETWKNIATDCDIILGG